MNDQPSHHCVIVGASHTAAQLVVSLRQGGFAGRITLIGDEADLPYHHPPLSKDFLSGAKAIEDILIRPPEAYAAASVDVRLSTRVTKIDRMSKVLSIEGGADTAYDTLILATGARVRKLPVPGADVPGVYYLRDSRDVRAIKSEIAPGRKAVIIGGGYIGLETAASLTQAGMSVTVLEAMPRILQRVTAPQLSEFYRRVHREEGVAIVEGAQVTAIKRSDTLSVHTQDGVVYDADFVIVGIGVIPNTELALEAGLEVENGIVVDAHCQTSDPFIYAAGDVTWHYNPIYDRHMRVESVPNATEQAKTVAAALNGAHKPFNALPWFWSDQFDLKLQIAGLSTGYDDVIIRGTVDAGRSFAAYYFKGDQLLAVDAVNAPRDFMMGKKLLGRGKTLAKAGLSDPEWPLKSLIV